MSDAVLVTGVAGFIGSHLAKRLVRQGRRVVGLDNFNDYYEPARKHENVRTITELGGDFSLVAGDIRDEALLTRLFAEHTPSGVAHLAAMAGVRTSVDAPLEYYDVNLTGTLKLLEAARRHGLPNFVFASTSSAYGRTSRLPFIEDDPADRPLAPYPASKRSAELLGHAYHHMHGLDFTALRFFTVYGPASRPDMMAYLVLDSMRTGRSVPLYGSRGRMYRDWTYVDDITQGIASALDRRLGYEVINLGRGEPVDLLHFISELEGVSGKKASLVPAPMNPADVEGTLASIAKARRLLDYEPRTSVSEGVKHFYDWFVRNVGAIG